MSGKSYAGKTTGEEWKMHPEFLQMTLHDHQRDLDQRTRFTYTGESFSEPRDENQDAVELRLCRVDDDPALDRLAMLEGRPAPAGRYVIAVHHAMADGSWERLKACRASDCEWAFIDSARNHSRAWCSMKSCGNREKARAFRERHRHG